MIILRNFVLFNFADRIKKSGSTFVAVCET